MQRSSANSVRNVRTPSPAPGRARRRGGGVAIVTLLLATAATGAADPAVIGHDEAVEIARQRGWIIRQESDLHILELHDIEGGIPRYYITHNLDAADTISTDECQPGGISGYDLTGAGVRLGVWDGGGVLPTHQEYNGRVTWGETMDPAAHATHVAGTMIAAGVFPGAWGYPAGQTIGGSPAATLISYEWNNDLNEMAAEAANGLRVSNHSYGYVHGWYYNSYYEEWFWYGDVTVSTVEENRFGLYSSVTADIDQIAANNPRYLICKSAGNDRADTGPGPGGGHYYYNPQHHQFEWSTDTRNPDGPYDSVGTKGSAKNILTVGAVEDVVGGYTDPAGVPMTFFSCWGPTDDGRVKPDITANGWELLSCHSQGDAYYATSSGTSMSTPSVAGSLGLLIELWRNTHLGELDPLAATLKGLVIHTADETGAAPGPDYEYGWGLMNTLRAADTIAQDADLPTTIQELDLSDGDTYTFTHYGLGGRTLRATLCWTDPAGTPPGNLLDPADKMLVNDLDLRIEHVSSSHIYEPWVLDPATPTAPATTGDNDTDNVEQIVFDFPNSGEFEVQVSHKGSLSGGHQAFTLIISELGREVGYDHAQLLPTGAGDRAWLGYAVAMDGDTAVLGAPLADDLADDAGAAYVYTWNDSAWVEAGQLLAGDGAASDEFGTSVAVSGGTIFVGAPLHDAAALDAGAVYVFNFDGNDWVQTDKLTPTQLGLGDEFGTSVAIDGDYAIVGAPFDVTQGLSAGAAYAFVYEGLNGWVLQQRILPADGAALDRFGWSVALSGQTALVGAPLEDDAGLGAGAAYTFLAGGGQWMQEAKLLPTGWGSWQQFGSAVAIDGDTALVGAPGDDLRSPNAGAAFLFDRYDGGWTFIEQALPPAARADGFGFGARVAIDGNIALIGAFGADDLGPDGGAVSALRRDEGVWIDDATLLPIDGLPQERFGAVAVSGSRAIIGAYEDHYNGFAAGSAFAFGGLDDCDNNGRLDVTDITAGRAEDLDGNGNPDACDQDCNHNGVLDTLELTQGLSLDCNGNAVPDECEVITTGDFNADGLLDVADFLGWYACTAGPQTAPQPAEPACTAACLTAFDLDADGDVDMADLADWQLQLPPV